MANEGNDAPVQQTDRVAEPSPETSSSGSALDLTSSQTNDHISEMSKSSLQNSQDLLNSWNNVSIDFGNEQGGKESGKSENKDSASVNANTEGNSATESKDASVTENVSAAESKSDAASESKGNAAAESTGNPEAKAGTPTTSGADTISFPHTEPHPSAPGQGKFPKTDGIAEFKNSLNQSQGSDGARPDASTAKAQGASSATTSGPDTISFPHSEPHPSAAGQGKFPKTDGVSDFVREIKK